MKKILIPIILLLSLALIGCEPQSVQKEATENLQPETVQDIQPTEPVPAQPAEEIDLPEEDSPESELNEIEIECNLGLRCLDAHRIGFQTGRCEFVNVKACIGGCENDVCSERLPPEVTKDSDHPVIDEGQISYDRAGWQFVDFGKEISTSKRIFYDVKIKQYSPQLEQNYYRSESSRYALWIVAKPFESVTFLDCYNERDERTQYKGIRSGSTLCVKTIAGNIAAVGGNWEGVPTEEITLSWKLFQ